ncbi:MAG: hypothetical protein P8176_05875 [Gammaproteobacteria bacterium]
MGIGVDIFTAGTGMIDTAQSAFTKGLAGANAEDPKALIKLQILAFMFTNTVSSVSGTLQSVSSATQSAAGKIGQ